MATFRWKCINFGLQLRKYILRYPSFHLLFWLFYKRLSVPRSFLEYKWLMLNLPYPYHLPYHSFWRFFVGYTDLNDTGRKIEGGKLVKRIDDISNILIFDGSETRNKLISEEYLHKETIWCKWMKISLLSHLIQCLRIKL